MYAIVQKINSLPAVNFVTSYLNADIICKQFAPRSGPTKYRAWSGSELCDTLRLYSGEFFFF